MLPKRLVQYAMRVTPTSTTSGYRTDPSSRRLAEPWKNVHVNRDGGAGALAGLLAGAHLAVPDDLPTLLSEHGSRLGASAVVLFLVDYDQRVLVPVDHAGAPSKDALSIDGTVAGRSFRGLDRTATLPERPACSNESAKVLPSR